jgi:AraC-like DNA-binding protein
LVAIAVGFVLTVPLIEDAHWGVTYAHPGRTISWLHARLIHTTMLGCIGIFAVQAPLFLWRCRSLLLRHANTRGAEARWLQLPLVVVATTWMLGLLRTLQCATHAPKELALVFALADVGVTVGAVYVLVRRVSFGEPAAPFRAPAAAGVPPPAGKYARSNLDGATRQRIRRKIEQALAGQELTSDSLLNLRSLSRAINEKAHYVSQVINQDLDTNFYELVNRHRIARAKQLLLARQDRTILEIALAVGFNSKSTFNTAFRRLTGVTPSGFRASSKG